MSSSNTRTTNWRQRMVEKERREKEAIAYLVELERAKHAILNEFNFPSHLVSAAWPVSAQISGFADRAAEADRKDQIDQQIREYRKERAKMEAQSDRKFASGVVTFQGLGFRPHRQMREEDEESYYEEPAVESTEELYPPHRGKRYCSEPDSDGWRLVVRRQRTKRELTNAELEQLARSEILGTEEDSMDVNGDLNERNQRREFY